MDVEVALLAERVAAAADASLRDPQDTQVYARLVAATLAWRRGPSPALDAASVPERPEASTSTEPATPVVLPPRLGDALGEVIADLHRRHRPSSDGPDAAAAPSTPATT